MSDRPLTDHEVYDLIHQALLSFSGHTVETERAQHVLTTAIRQLDILQTAFTALMDEATEKPPSP